MANIVNFSTYGFLNDILAMNEENWRKYFKPIVYDSVQTGLEVTAGVGMTFNVSAGECRCGSIMGILNSSVSLDVSIGDTDYDRIDSIVAQYIYDDPSTLSIAVIEGTASASPVSPTLTKSYNILWQIELAQILIPSNATTSTECTITDKRIIYNSLDSIIDPINENINSLSTDIHENINSLSTDIHENINSLSTDINENINSLSTNINENINSLSTNINEAIISLSTDIDENINTAISTLNDEIINLSTVVDDIAIYKANQQSVAQVFNELATYAKDDCVVYQGNLYRFNNTHIPGPWIGGNEVTQTNALAESGGGGGSSGVGDEITFDDTNNAMIITSSSRSISSLEGAVAVVATVIEGAESHAAITSGQYVYVTMHVGVTGLVDLPEGLYIANSDISANAALNTTNLSSVSGGGLNSLLDKVNKLEVLVVDCGTISSLPITIDTGSAVSVEDDMVVLQSVFGTPLVATSNWTVTTNNGSLTISGSIISGSSTTLTLYLMKSR